MMRFKSTRPQVYRVCAVCGKRHGATYGFRVTLRRFGIKGDKAVPECVRKLGATRKELPREEWAK